MRDSSLKPRDFYQELLYQVGIVSQNLKSDAKRQYRYYQKHPLELLVNKKNYWVEYSESAPDAPETPGNLDREM